MQGKFHLGNSIFISAFNVKSLGSVRILCDLVHDLHNLKLFDKITVNCSKDIGANNFPKEVNILRSGIWDSNFLLKVIWQYVGLWVHSYFNHYRCMLSINNLTPNFKSDLSILYLHNALPFANYVRPSCGKWLRVVCQQFYFKILLPFGLERNSIVVVQQLTLKNQFLSRFCCMANKVAIVPPKIPQIKTKKNFSPVARDYIYLPTNDLCYKNADTLLFAFSNLGPEYSNLDLIVTLNENCKLVKILKRNKKLDFKNIKFVGPQSWESNVALLENAKALLWGSSIESWGLPLSEAVSLNVDIIAPRLPYVEETLGQYANTYLYAEINEKSVRDGIEAWKLQNRSIPVQRQLFKTSQLAEIFNPCNEIE